MKPYKKYSSHDYSMSGADSGGPWRPTGGKITAEDASGSEHKPKLGPIGGMFSDAEKNQMDRMYAKDRYKK